MIKCPKCDKASADGFDGEGKYTPGLPCCNCGHTEPAAQPAAPAETESRGAVLRLVPTISANAESRRTACRQILLEALQRIEMGEIEELVLVTANSKQSPAPYNMRWHFSDPIRMSGLLHCAASRLGAPPFVTIT